MKHTLGWPPLRPLYQAAPQKATDPAAMDPGDSSPPLDDDLPKQLVDLPDEVISQICEHLIPDRSHPKPFQHYEMKSTIRSLRVSGWENFGFISGNEPSTQEYVTRHFSGVEVTSKSRIRDFRAFTQPSKARKRRKNDLANFAATCRRFSSQGQTMYARRTFTLTISNHGITFESLRDAFPLQTFCVLPKDQGGLQPGWAMVDPAKRSLVLLPKNNVPGNVAFNRFSVVFKSLRTLRIQVDVDMEEGHNKKTCFFLGQLGRFLLSQPAGAIALSKLEVDFNLGFHDYKNDYANRPYEESRSQLFGNNDSNRMEYDVPRSLREASGRIRIGERPIPIARLTLSEVSDTLATFDSYVQKFLTKQNHRQIINAGITSITGLEVKLSILGDGTDGMQWGSDTVIWRFYSSNGWGSMANTTIRREQKAEFGNFEDFCNDLQHRLHGSSPTARNRIVGNAPLVCELGLPLPKVPKPTAKKGVKGRRESRNGDEITGESVVNNSKRRRVG